MIGLASGQLDDPIAAIGQAGGGLGLLAFAVFYIARQFRQGASDVAAVSDNATITLLQQQEKHITVQDDRIVKLSERIAVMEDRQREHASFLQVHAAWDFQVLQQIRVLDPSITLEEAPPLYPPAADLGGAAR